MAIGRRNHRKPLVEIDDTLQVEATESSDSESSKFHLEFQKLSSVVPPPKPQVDLFGDTRLTAGGGLDRWFSSLLLVETALA
jgi:hypothetical protein